MTKHEIVVVFVPYYDQDGELCVGTTQCNYSRDEETDWDEAKEYFRRMAIKNLDLEGYQILGATVVRINDKILRDFVKDISQYN